MNAYPWPLDEMRARADAGSAAAGPVSVLGALDSFLTPLYAALDGASWFDGALRLWPLAGDREHGVLPLVEWNDPRGWKRFEPPKRSRTFYFASNGFGDLFGLPVTEELAIADDRVGILWTEKYEYQEAVVPWKDFFPRLFTDPKFPPFFARTTEHEWAAGHLGKPAPWQCFSSNVAPALNGKQEIGNISIQSLPVHVAFTLQIFQQIKERGLKPGDPLPMVDLYDEQGNLID